MTNTQSWVSTGSLKHDELNPGYRYVNDLGLGWDRISVDLAIERYAMRAYRGYGEVTDFKNYQGLPMPEWKDLPPQIQEAWRNSVKTVLFECGYTEGLSSPDLEINLIGSSKPFDIG